MIAWKPQKIRHVLWARDEGRSVYVAVRWFKNGDHPADMCRVMTDPATGKHFLSDGWLVQRFRGPQYGDHVCDTCNKPFDAHGWIDTAEMGGGVCPGDWVLSDQYGWDQVLTDDQYRQNCIEIMPTQRVAS